MNKAAKLTLAILGTIAIFTLTRLAIPQNDFSEVFLSPPEVYAISIIDAIWAILAITVSVAYWYWIWKK
ncbi:MAG: hypothetical protein KKD18_01385 [Nanoarchaeota archaeon]|nr:hypothetical protein [Nanoarchaeota archaeon]MBU0977046.1 hypothetical protein [Nanoarchaeota archaeon]